jgi:putative heme-binding domain-containing protein
VLDGAADPAARCSAARTLAQSTTGATRLAALAAGGKLSGDIAAAIAEEINRHPEPAIRALAAQLFPASAQPGGQWPPLEELAKIPGDAVRGRSLVFGRAECAKCHRFGNEGNTIGPDLSGIGRKLDRTRLLDAILNPSSAIATGFEIWLISTSDGRLFSAFVIGEGETILLKDAAGNQHEIPVGEIESRKQQTVSLMPQIASLQLTSQDLADIAEFLSRQQSETATAGQ